ncbi:MAG: PP2C family protein-serine/threonine phosphatase [Terracidiphilus sp.]
MAVLTALMLALPGALAAQSVLAVSAQQCVWRAGDDPAWAAPNLDETGWGPFSQWKIPVVEPHLWARCHADLGALRGTAHPAIQVRLEGAYQLFVNGERVGGAGNVETGFYSMNTMREYPLLEAALQTQPETIAVRITFRQPIGDTSPLKILAGDSEALTGHRAGVVLAESATPLAMAAWFALTGVVGLMLLGLFYYDRSRVELLYLSLTCVAVAVIRAEEFFFAAQMNYPWALGSALFSVANIVATFASLLVFFSLAQRRVPLLYWLALAIEVVRYALIGFTLLLPPDHALWLLDWIGTVTSKTPVVFIGQVALSTSPFVAFWPYGKITDRMRPLAILCMLWTAANLLWFAADATANFAWGLPNLLPDWRPELLGIRALVTVCVLVGLLALLFREQRQVTQERAMLAGEMQAARAVQEVIIPDAIPSVPGLRIESVYKSAGEVGGDFFQILPTAAEGVLIVIGDVSGKGMPAALTVSLLVGTVRTLAHYTQSPGEMLAAMNQRMLGRQQGGFTTCLVLRVDRNGRLTGANAGHLSPYLNGSELSLENGLPLGLDAHATYPESQFQLPPGGQLTLITDGVAEARNAHGDLFGFVRTAAISTQTAESIASAAQRFGQEDDITVLTVTRLAVDRELRARAATPAIESA